MRFYFPEFLFALTLIAIPVIIHLFNFRKFKKIEFSNTSFLREIQIQTSSRQKIKERLILISRILAITFLVMAFAKPYFQDQDQNAKALSSTVSIYLDNSYSMEAINKEGSLLDEGKRKAAEIVNTYGLNDKFQLLTNDLSGAQSRLLNKEEFIDAVEKVKISAESVTHQQILNAQTRFLNTKHHTNKVAYLISDFQRIKEPDFNPDSTIQFNLVALEGNKLPNVAIDSIWFLSPLHQPKAEERLCVRLSNYSDQEVKNVAINLTIDGKVKALGGLNIKPNKSNIDTIVFSGLEAGWYKAQLSIKDYPIVFDNQLYFSFKVKQSLAVTIINDLAQNNSFATAFSTENFFKVSNIGKSQINYSDLKAQQLVVLNGIKSVPSGLAQQLKEFLVLGGNVAVFLPADADLSSYQEFLQSVNADYPTALVKDTLASIKLNLGHPIFQNVFENVPKNINLPVAYQYFSFTKNTRSSRQDLMVSASGNSLLSNYKTGKGNLYLTSFLADPATSNFFTHGLFLPVLFKMALLVNQEEALFYTIGKSEGLLFNKLDIAESDVLKLKANEQEIIPEIRITPAGTVLFLADQVKKSGFYNLQKENNTIAVLAFNESRAESVMDFYNSEQLREKFNLKPDQIINAGTASIENQIKEVKLGTSLWKLCLILVLIFLAIEILLIRFFKIQQSKTANT